MHSTQPRSVVVGIDDTEQSEGVLRWAVAEAGRRHLGLTIVHSCWIASQLDAMASGVSGLYDRAAEDGQRILADAVTLVSAAAPDMMVKTELVTGSPLQNLIEYSGSAPLVVVGAGDGPLDRLLGSTAYGLVRQAQCPVLVVRGDVSLTNGESRPVVVGIDGSPTSVATVGPAFEEAAERATHLVAVHAWSDTTDDSMYLDAGFEIPWLSVESEQRRLLAEILAGWCEKYPDVVVEHVIVRDQPRDALLSWSAKAQLVVVGSHGRGGFQRMLLGSTSHALVEHAQCPVLVIRG